MNIEQIAKIAGVSKTTVSYVLNNKAKQYRVSDKTINKVQAVIDKYNFRPSSLAIGLKSGITKTIGLIIPDLNNESYIKIANFIEKKSQDYGYQLLIASSEDDIDKEKQAIHNFISRNVDAIIISSSAIAEQNNDFYQLWNNVKIPIFGLDRSLDPTKFSNIVGHDYNDARLLAKKLATYVTNKQEVVFYLGAKENLAISKLRIQGFTEIFKENKYNLVIQHTENYSRQSAYITTKQWLSQHKNLPKYFFVTSFVLLLGVIQAIVETYKNIPDDIVIATFGDNLLLDFLPCTTLSASQQYELISTTLIDFINNFLNNNFYKPGLNTVKRKITVRGLK